MGWFDPPAITLRRRVPHHALRGFNAIEEMALEHLENRPEQHRPYQLGVVLALWMKAGELAGEIALPTADSRKVQLVYESCMKVLKSECLPAFSILTEMAEQQLTFGVPADLYRQLSFNVLG